MLHLSALAARRLVFGLDPARRGIFRLTLLAFVAHALFVLGLAALAAGGAVPAAALTRVSIFEAAVVGAFYGAIRLRLDLRLGSPGLPVAHVLAALASLGILYATAPGLREGICMLAPLTVMLGTFVASPAQCRLLGGLAPAVFVLAVLLTPRDLATAPATAGALSLHLAFTAVLMPVTAAIAGFFGRLRLQATRHNAELSAALERIKQLATTDELTGLPNRRHIGEVLDVAMADCTRRGAPLSVCLIDIDHFKRVNDTHGHAGGDEVLRRVTQLAQKALRQGDRLGRWGGEEFLLVLPATPLATAIDVVARVRERIASAEAWAERPELQVTFSAGVGERLPDEVAERLVDRVDRALYDAKEGGRDRTAAAGHPPGDGAGVSARTPRCSRRAPSVETC